MKLELKDIQPNPFRRTDRYPVIREKIEQLKESIEKTGFWENIVVRQVDGKYQIAYGHNRLQALKEMYPGSMEFDWHVRKLSDTEMIQMMARENAEIYRSNIQATIETVRATVEAYAKGVITKEELPEAVTTTGRNTGAIRVAPGFCAVASGDGATAHFQLDREGKVISGQTVPLGYTADGLGKFLGMTRKNRDGFRASETLQLVLDALELEELGYIKKTELKQPKLKSELGALIGRAGAKQARDKAERLRQQQEEAKLKAQAEAEKVAERRQAEEEAARKAKAEERAAREAQAKAEEAERRAKEEKDAASKREADQARRAADEAERKAEEQKAREQKARENREAAERAARQAKRERKQAEKRAAFEKEARELHEKYERKQAELLVLAKEYVSAGRRALATKYHPDRGGTSEDMIRVNGIYKWLLHLVQENDGTIDLYL